MKAFFEFLGSVVFWTFFLIIFFRFNPWSYLVDWIQKVRGKEPVFDRPRVRIIEKERSRISTAKVFVATTIVDGNVVQEHVVAKNDVAARNLAADRLRVEPEDVDVEEIVEKVIRR